DLQRQGCEQRQRRRQQAQQQHARDINPIGPHQLPKPPIQRGVDGLGADHGWVHLTRSFSRLSILRITDRNAAVAAAHSWIMRDTSSSADTPNAMETVTAPLRAAA